MQSHIERVKFISLNVEKNTFNQIHRGKLTNIILENTFKETCQQKNEFIRFKWENWYMDLTIVKILYKDHITIILGKVIDYNKPKQ